MTDSPEAPSPRKINMDAGRRAFIKATGLGAAAIAIVGATEAQAAPDIDTQILNFALNSEYLESTYYLTAAYGGGLAESEITGDGQVGAVTGGRQASFSNPIVASYAQEIANDEMSHVKFLRSVLGGKKAARPALNIGSAFTVAAQAAGVVGPNETFDPYANDLNFLLGSYILADVGASAYLGAAAFVTNKTYLSAAASILSVEGYHAGTTRTLLFAQQSNLALKATALISSLRATLSQANDDQGIGADQSTHAGGPLTPSNIVPTDANSLAFPRTPRQVLNVVYGKIGASKGLFFPQGINLDNVAKLVSVTSGG